MGFISGADLVGLISGADLVGVYIRSRFSGGLYQEQI